MQIREKYNGHPYLDGAPLVEGGDQGGAFILSRLRAARVVVPNRDFL